MTSIKNTSASILRVQNHNNWPAIDLFPCEKEFRARLAKNNIQQIFVTATLFPNEKDEKFNSFIGHILDGLDALPYRPDVAFDYMYRIIDQGKNNFSADGQSQAKSLTAQLFGKNFQEWSRIVNVLCEKMPQQTADYIALRILDACVVSKCEDEEKKNANSHADEIRKRASRVLGKERYAAIQKKFLVKRRIDDKCELTEFPYENRRNAGRFFRLLFKLSTPFQSPKSSSDQWIDLSQKENLLDIKTKMESLIDLALATYRNERFHGDSFSPFRSSKATLKTYSHAYYLLMITYILALGIMELHEQGEITINEIEKVTQNSVERFANFFSESLAD